MLSIFSRLLKPGVTVEDLKEDTSKYYIKLAYKGMTASCELTKTCAPGDEEFYCKQAIRNAMSTMYINTGDLKTAEKWLHGEM